MRKVRCGVGSGEHRQLKTTVRGIDVGGRQNTIVGVVTRRAGAEMRDEESGGAAVERLAAKGKLSSASLFSLHPHQHFTLGYVTINGIDCSGRVV